MKDTYICIVGRCAIALSSERVLLNSILESEFSLKPGDYVVSSVTGRLGNETRCYLQTNVGIDKSKLKSICYE